MSAERLQNSRGNAIPQCYCIAAVTLTSLVTFARLPPSNTTRVKETFAVRFVVVNPDDWTGDDEIERRVLLWLQSWSVFRAADDPFGGSANHFALVVEQKAHGMGGFNFFGEIVLHLQLHHRLLAGDLWR